jgi:hypothetical protein
MKTTLSKPPLVVLACTVLGQLIFAHSLWAGDLAPMLQPILTDSKLPSIAAAVVIGDKIESAGAVGVRKLGEPTPVTVNDKYHLGSCTKTMTAALTSMLVSVHQKFGRKLVLTKENHHPPNNGRDLSKPCWIESRTTRPEPSPFTLTKVTPPRASCRRLWPGSRGKI